MEQMFTLSKYQKEKLAAWVRSLPPANIGASGGRLSYTFTPTALGTIVNVKDDCTSACIDLTDYDSW